MEDENLPTGFQLMPAYPNPFNPVTTIRYQLPTTSDVRMTVYDILGKEVNVLLHEKKNAGTYTLQWNGTNRFGQPVASGTYFIIMEALNFNQIQKVLLIK
jgi:flagellar hook assembly protein FlgD